MSSCISKLFSGILNNRLDHYMSSHNKWSVNQGGFMKGHRIEDNMFILNTVYQSYVKKKKCKVFCAFVDFRKYFDRINTDMLLYKLLKCNKTGNYYKIIKSMYSNTLY